MRRNLIYLRLPGGAYLFLVYLLKFLKDEENLRWRVFNDSGQFRTPSKLLHLLGFLKHRFLQSVVIDVSAAQT